MPEVSRFFGIIITLYFKDHGPPHFHVKYGDQRAVFSIVDLRLLEGAVPPRVLSLVLEWAFQYRPALIEDWELARAEKPLKKIPPLA